MYYIYIYIQYSMTRSNSARYTYTCLYLQEYHTLHCFSVVILRQTIIMYCNILTVYLHIVVLYNYKQSRKAVHCTYVHCMQTMLKLQLQLFLQYTRTHATKVLFCASGLLTEQKRTTLHNLISPDDQCCTNDIRVQRCYVYTMQVLCIWLLYIIYTALLEHN